MLRRPGRGIEPGARRDYAPGDDVRLVDWPAYARLERLLVKVPEELPEPRLDLLVDGSGSMAYGAPRPGLRACLAAAALAACAAARGVRVTTWWVGAPGDRLELRRPEELVRLLRFLAGRAPSGAGHWEGPGARLGVSAGGRGSAVILSDGLDPAVAGAARRARLTGHDTRVVRIAVAAELPAALAAAAAEAGLAELVDAETGRRRLHPAGPLALAQAAAARDRSGQALEGRLEALGIPCDTLAPSAPFESVALRLLGARASHR